MLVKLAVGNLRKSIRDYAVYFVTLVLGVAVFYAFNTISSQADFLKPEYGDLIGLLGDILKGLTVFLALVLGFLMVYANNYLVRRRKRELGLYQVLGMRRSQVSGVLTLETLMASLVSLGVGLLVGVLLSQALVFVTAALFHEQVTEFQFRFSFEALGLTLACFGIMFVVMLLLNLRTLNKVKLVDLMGADRANESMKVRSLPLSAVLFVVTCVLIGAGYVRFLRDGFPIADMSGSSSTQFLITTVMVFAGTLLFFYAVAGFILVAFQRLRRLYWSGLNMFTLRQLNARINTTSLSMGVIALILFLAITSVTGGMSICNTMSGNIEQHTPVDASVNIVFYGEHPASQDDDNIAVATVTQDFAALMAEAAGNIEQHTPVDASVNIVFYGEHPASQDDDNIAVATVTQDFAALMAEAGYDLHTIGDTCQLTVYDARDRLADPGALTISAIHQATGAPVPMGMENSDSDTSGLDVMAESDFNAWRAFLGLEPVRLGENGYIVTCDMGSQIVELYDGMMAAGYPVVIDGRELLPAQVETIADRSASLSVSTIGSNPGTLVVPDEVALACTPYAAFVNVLYTAPTDEADALVNDIHSKFDSSGVFVENGKRVAFVSTCLYAAFVNVLYTAPTDEADALVNDIHSKFDSSGVFVENGKRVAFVSTCFTETDNWSQMNGLTGVVSYMAIYIGFVLVISCAAILAIQQLSSTSDSQGRYRLLSELGCPQRLIYRSLLVQTLVYFLFPLAVAMVHSFVALQVVIDAVSLFGGIDIAQVSLLAVVLFVVVYGGYLFVTYRVARGVVRTSLVGAVRRV